jgi:AraC-like DNA-binding protein
LRPGVAASLLSLDVAELAGRSERIENLSAGSRELAALDDLDMGLQLPRSIASLERLLMGMMRRVRLDDAVARAIDAVERHRGNCSVARLAHHVCLGERQFARRFTVQTGVSPKSYAQLVRFRQVRDRLTAPSAGADLAAIASEAGYADQAHMTREFRRYAGVSPLAHRRQARVGFLQFDPPSGC